MTTISINGAPHEVPPATTLAALVAALGATPQAIATAVNADFVPRDARAQLVLREGDAVFTFQPVTGG